MGAKNMYPLRSLGPKDVELNFRFYPNFTSDVTVATGLYLALLNRSQELKITKSGLTGNVRVLVFAVTPEKPINHRRH